MSARVAVIDSGICNLRSVTKALEAVGAAPTVVRTPAELRASAADGLVLPGVGALRDCVASLRESGLDGSVRDWIGADRPFLGVCLGMQALFDSSEEGVRGSGSSWTGGALPSPAGLQDPPHGLEHRPFRPEGDGAPAGPFRGERGLLFRPQLPLRACGSARLSSVSATTGLRSSRRWPAAGCSPPSSTRRRARPRACRSIAISLQPQQVP